MKKFFMQIILLSVMGCAVACGALIAKCINQTHKYAKTIQEKGGKSRRVTTYECNVASTEAANFDKNKHCKNCGCHVDYHTPK